MKSLLNERVFKTMGEKKTRKKNMVLSTNDEFMQKC